ncbi:YdeI/OmpD-associated family protein [Cucumibacter marinus]|uniref:YdeI/OmpD-associated family protein n=1 Tax=Cucumibacter marinus TaxID=1121252 RepID=UPI0004175A91|nr:YdeI/OmpD-associated family protein [Cucumibacter marinus]
MQIDPDATISFETPQEFAAWLADHHARQNEVWIKLYKKASGIPSITWEEAVIEALAWGWIDAIKKSGGEDHWFQRFTPRKPRSAWSAKNRAHAEKLIAEGRMQPPGLAQIEAAQKDGRWHKTYAGQSSFQMPRDVLEAIAAEPRAQAHYDALDRRNRFAIYLRVISAKKPETRTRRIAGFVDMLTRGEKLY